MTKIDCTMYDKRTQLTDLQDPHQKERILLVIELVFDYPNPIQIQIISKMASFSSMWSWQVRAFDSLDHHLLLGAAPASRKAEEKVANRKIGFEFHHPLFHLLTNSNGKFW